MIGDTHKLSALRTLMFATVSASALLVAPAALAQTAPTPAAEPAPAEQDSNATQDIIVTAQFREQRLQDTPIAITAINSALLESRGQTSIAEVAQQAPNVTLVPGGAAFGASLGASIRGVGQFDFNPAYEPGVGLYVDDVYFATLTGSVFDLLDLDRVEVLRGPQGTLTGRNSIGGAIKLFSKKPDGNGGGFVEGTYGSRNQINFRGGADFKLTDSLFGRISGVFKKQEGYVDQVDYGCAKPGNAEGITSSRTPGNCTVSKLGGTNYAALRGQLRYNPNNDVDINLAADYTDDDHSNPAEVLTVSRNANFLCGKYCTYASYTNPAVGTALGTNPSQAARQVNTDNHQVFRGGGVSLNAVFGLTDSLKLTSITAYRQYLSTFGTDDDFTPTLTGGAGGNNKLNHNFFSQELRLNAKLGELAELTVGGYYSKQKTTYYTLQDIRYIIPGTALQFYGDDPVHADSKAAFGTIIVHPTEGLTLTGGLRYTKESKSYSFVRRNLDGTLNTFLDPLGQLNQTTARYKGDKLDYRASVDYRFSPSVLAYATISTGFKGGGVSARPFNATQALQGNFVPETLDAYEIGLKTDLLNKALRINVSAFINKYKNVQLPISDCSAYGGGPCGVVTNAGDSRFHGVEVEVTANPIRGLSFDGSASYLDAKWNRLDPRVGTSVSVNNPATSAPKWKWSAGLQYEADLGDSGSLTPRIDASYNDRRYNDQTINLTPYYLPSYTLVNGRLAWKNAGKDLEIAAEVKNIFNEYYYTQRFQAVYAFSGTAYNSLGRPREWSVSINKKF